MAKGIEIRGNSIRLVFRYEGVRYQETLPGKATPENVARAEHLARLIQVEIQMGTYDHARHFPNSRALEDQQFGKYLDSWLDIQKSQLAPSSYRGQKSRVDCHVRPKWGTAAFVDIDHIELEQWLRALPLHNKSIKEVLTIMRGVVRLYRRKHRDYPDPTDDIKIRLPSNDDPDPFTRAEIDRILSTATDRPAELRMCEYMIWDGPRVSEALAVAWEDVDLKAGTVHYRRALVEGSYKVPKTKRSKRKVQLLAPALRALEEQYRLTGQAKPVEIEVLEADNRTKRKQKVRFVWLNSRTGNPMRGDTYLRESFLQGHLATAGIRYRGPGQFRHTFASQMLSAGIVPIQWLVDHMGHTTTEMIYKRYGRWIVEDAPDIPSMVNQKLGLK